MILSDSAISKMWRTFHDLETMVEQVETIAKSRLQEWLTLWGRITDDPKDYTVWVGDFAELVKDQRIKVVRLGDRNNDDFLWMPLDFLRQGGYERELQRRSKVLEATDSLRSPLLVGWMRELMEANFATALEILGDLMKGRAEKPETVTPLEEGEDNITMEVTNG